MEPSLAVDLSARIAAVGAGISALELLSVRREFSSTGIFGLRTVAPFRLDTVALRLAERSTVGLMAAQALGALVLVLAGPFSVPGQVAVALVTVAVTALRWRRVTGGDGAEQMATIILLATALAVLPVPGEQRVVAAVVFIAAQTVLAYGTAGIAKLASPMWRRGEALPAILATDGHGHPWAAAMLRQRPGIGLFAGWAVIVFEVSFIATLALPGWAVLAILALGMAFHLACAVLMGLNSFLWSFPATYPCVYVCAIASHAWLAGAMP